MAILISANAGWDRQLWVDKIAELDPVRDVIADDASPRLGEVRYALVWKAPQGLLGRLPKLEVIFNLGAGVDAILADTTIPPHIPIVRIVDDNLTHRMSEWIALQVLIHHRQTLVYQERQRAGIWEDQPGQPAAAHVTVGIMGLGELGRDAARVLAALGFRLVGWSRTRREVPGVTTFAGDSGLDAFLAETDILVCLLPLTPETTGILDRRLFSKLKQGGPLGGPFLVNAGRGLEQKEADILAALADGTLRGASLDVFEEEPLPASSPLWRHPHVIVTPHNAADSEPDSLTRYILAQIAAHEAGKPLQNVVDRKRGY